MDDCTYAYLAVDLWKPSQVGTESCSTECSKNT